MVVPISFEIDTIALDGDGFVDGACFFDKREGGDIDLGSFGADELEGREGGAVMIFEDGAGGAIPVFDEGCEAGEEFFPSGDEMAVLFQDIAGSILHLVGAFGGGFSAE